MDAPPELAEQRRVEVVSSAEAWLQELVDEGSLTTEQKEQILQRLTSQDKHQRDDTGSLAIAEVEHSRSVRFMVT